MQERYYLPVGQLQLEKIYQLGLRQFHPLGPGNPIFWPNLRVEDAAWMARSYWSGFPPGYVGYVLAFSFQSALAEEVEYWSQPREKAKRLVYFPSERFDDFNNQVIFPIHVVGAYFGPGHKGITPSSGALANLLLDRQLEKLADVLLAHPADAGDVIRENQLAIFVNFSYWLKHGDLFALDVVRRGWQATFPELPLPTRGEGMVALDGKIRELVDVVQGAIQRGKAGSAINKDEMAGLIDQIATLYKAQENPEKACIYWRKIAYGPSMTGIPALEELRSIVGQMGRERDDFVTKLSPLELLEAFVKEQTA